MSSPGKIARDIGKYKYHKYSYSEYMLITCSLIFASKYMELFQRETMLKKYVWILVGFVLLNF